MFVLAEFVFSKSAFENTTSGLYDHELEKRIAPKSVLKSGELKIAFIKLSDMHLSSRSR